MSEYTLSTKIHPRTYTPYQIEILDTLCKGHCCNLKLDDGTHRVWLCRVAGGITVETFQNGRGRWRITSGGCNASEAVVDDSDDSDDSDDRDDSAPTTSPTGECDPLGCNRPCSRCAQRVARSN